MNTSLMPVFSKLSTATDVGDSEHSSELLQKSELKYTEIRIYGDIESAVAFKEECQDRTIAMLFNNRPYCNAGADPSVGVSR